VQAGADLARVDLHHLRGEELVDDAIRAPFVRLERVDVLHDVHLVVHHGRQVEPAEAVVELVLELRIEEDHDAVILVEEQLLQRLLLGQIRNI